MKNQTVPQSQFEIKVKIIDDFETIREDHRLTTSFVSLEEEDYRLIYKHVL